jgi:hypothetical protein
MEVLGKADLEQVSERSGKLDEISLHVFVRILENG